MTNALPFGLPGYWFKGNLHTHTTQSDGLLAPQEAIEWYRSHGYDFVAISDHWVYTPGMATGFDGNFVTISGAELHGSGYHMLALGLSSLPDRSLQDDASALSRQVLAQGGLPFIAHPYWTGMNSTDVAAIEGIVGIEVFNTTCEIVRGTGYSQVVWDQLLSGGKRLWGLAVDDVHWKHHDEGQAFVMVRAASLDERSILQALRQGHFYASTGPRLTDMRIVHDQVNGPALRVQCSPCRTITFHGVAATGMRFEAPAGAWLDSAALPIKPAQHYLRVECRDDQGGVAWSNPIYVEDVLSA